MASDLDVFLGYSRNDLEAGTRLLGQLEKAGLKVFRDQERIRAGEYGGWALRVLHLEWKTGPGHAGDEATVAGFEAIKQREAEGSDGDLHRHAFTHAFLRSAKNFDLYVETDNTPIRDRLAELCRSLEALETLETFEREGTDLKGARAAESDLSRRAASFPSTSWP